MSDYWWRVECNGFAVKAFTTYSEAITFARSYAAVHRSALVQLISADDWVRWERKGK
jgi:hypothetical protein